MKNEKKFLNPEAEIIQFHAEDIIITSQNGWWDESGDVGGGSGGNVPHV